VAAASLQAGTSAGGVSAGGGGGRANRNAIVREDMQKHGRPLPQ
jgi:hypothetical protein